MTREVISVGPQASYAEIRSAMLKHDIGALPVVAADGALLGVVTEADLIAKEAFRTTRPSRVRTLFSRVRGRDASWLLKAQGRVAADLMTAQVATAGPEDELHAVARMMLQRKHKRLPVVAGGRIVGIVAPLDLLRPFDRSDEELTGEVERVLTDPVMPGDIEAHADVEHGVVRLWGSTRVPGDIAVVIGAIARIPGVVAVDSQLFPRDPNSPGRL